MGAAGGAVAPCRAPRPGVDHVPRQTAGGAQGDAGSAAGPAAGGRDRLAAGHSPGTLVGTVVCTGDGALALDEVQPESRAPMPAGDWARGVRLLAG